LFAENNLPPRTYEFTLTSRYQAAEGGDIIRLRWRYEDDTLTPFPSGYLSVYATGDPIHVINVDVAGDGTVTLEDVRAALEGDLDITNLVSIPILGTGDTGTVIDVADVAAPPAGEFIFDKEYQRELHLISNVALQAFFNINPPTAPYPFPNQLKDGDTLGIYYPYIKDPEAFFGPHADPTKVGGRRQATLTNNALAAVVETDSSQLFNSTYEPEKVAQGIPICKRIGDDLIFIDGTIVKGELDPLDPLYPPDGVRFGEHGYTLERIMLGASSIMVTLTEDWFGAVPLSSGSPASIQDVINAILKDLAGTGSPEGSELIGSQGNAGGGVSALITSLVAGSLWGQLIALQAGQNARAALGWDETVTGEWLFQNVQNFQQEQFFDFPPLVPVSPYLRGKAATATESYEVTLGTWSYYHSSQGDYYTVGLAPNVVPAGTWTVAPQSVPGTPGNAMFFGKTDDGWVFYLFEGVLAGDIISNFDVACTAKYELTKSGGLWYHNFKSDRYNFDTPNGGVLGGDCFIGGKLTVNGGTFGSPSYFNGSVDVSPVGGAHLTFGGRSFNGPIHGLEAKFESVSPTINRLEFHAGFGLVTGRGIRVVADKPYPDAVGQFMPSTALPVSFNESKFYYVWVDPDGEFWLDDIGPVWNSTYGAYLVDASQVIAPYSVYEYALVDIVWSVEGNTPGTIRFGTCPDLGGGRRYWQEVDTGTPMEHQVTERETVWINAGNTDFSNRDLKVAGGVGVRNPGVPLAVTKTAILKLHAEGRHTSSSPTDFINVVAQVVNLANVYQPPIPSLYRGAGYAAVHVNGYMEYGTEPSERVMSGILQDVVVDAVGGGQVRCGVESDASGNVFTEAYASIHHCGFIWDRMSNPQIPQ